MNKHVNKLNKEANDARRMIDDSESDSDDSDKESGANAVSKMKHSGEKPSEEQVEKLEEKLEAAQADQKNLFLIIFQVAWKILLLFTFNRFFTRYICILSLV